MLYFISICNLHNGQGPKSHFIDYKAPSLETFRLQTYSVLRQGETHVCICRHQSWLGTVRKQTVSNVMNEAYAINWNPLTLLFYFSDWFIPCRTTTEREMSSQFSSIIYYAMKYEETFLDKGCCAINFMPVEGCKLHRCFTLQLHKKSIASWCCTLISRQKLSLASVAGGGTHGR